MVVKNNIYNEIKITDNVFIRTFFQDNDTEELIWHRDKEDRIIKSLKPTDWLFQFDNQLPVKIEKEIFIPKNTYHRIIKGTNNLEIILLKIF